MSNGKLWLRTSEGEVLLFDPQTGELTDHSFACGMNGDIINSITIDAFNHVRNLTNWKRSDYRMPLLVTGARQTGKTHSILVFGKKEYRNVVNINFELNRSFKDIFEQNLEPKRIIREISVLSGETVFPHTVRNRTEAILHRLENAGLQRKIGKNQVRAIRILLTGSPEEMQRIEADGKLNEWCDDNLRWLGETYGKENIVSAVLHLDESTPHIHATLVPIVTTERRKKKSEEQVKKQYRKKNPNAPRLSADDVMTCIKLKEYQDTYALSMSKYELQRGIDGSEARHISTSQYYRELFAKNEDLKENIDNLLEKQKNAEKELSKVKSEVSKQKFKNAKAEMGANLMDGVNSLFGGSKVKQQQEEIEELKTDIQTLKEENALMHAQLHAREKEYTSVTEKLRAEFSKIYEIFPTMREILSIERLCRTVGLSAELTKRILTGDEVGFKGSLYSAEYKRKFTTEHSVARMEQEPKQPGKLRLSIDGVNIIE